MDDLDLLHDTGLSVTTTVHLDCLTVQLMTAVESCSRDGIPFPRIWEEVEDALDMVPRDLPIEWRLELRQYLSDHVVSAFMNAPDSGGTVDRVTNSAISRTPIIHDLDTRQVDRPDGID
ncbi:hypothetical protein [Nocardia sp. NPDC058666]|uniref:hypothetical protein n=1 Tax=unclassified Nocardia TaxID=2637762 RepID=UPI0036484615